MKQSLLALIFGAIGVVFLLWVWSPIRTTDKYGSGVGYIFETFANWMGRGDNDAKFMATAAFIALAVMVWMGFKRLLDGGGKKHD